LRTARAFSIAENVAKARPRISNCRYRISSILQQNLYIKMKETSAARGKFMVIIWPFELSELCRPDVQCCCMCIFLAVSLQHWQPSV